MAKELDDLVKQASKKLKAEKKQVEETEKTVNEVVQDGEDIYADFRSEETYPDIKKTPAGKEPQTEDTAEVEEELPADLNDFQIYENGPYKSQIDIWKKQFGAGCVIHTQVIDKHFVFHTLNRYEYKQLIAMENVDALMREEIICNNCILFPRNYNFKSMAVQEAGYPSTLAQIILENSGFTKDYALEIL